MAKETNLSNIVQAVIGSVDYNGFDFSDFMTDEQLILLVSDAYLSLDVLKALGRDLNTGFSVICTMRMISVIFDGTSSHIRTSSDIFRYTDLDEDVTAFLTFLEMAIERALYNAE